MPISYRLLVKYHVVTGHEDDAKAAQTAVARLKEAIERALGVRGKPARLDGLKHLADEFKNFADTFAEILKVKRARAHCAKSADAQCQYAALQARRAA